MLALSDTQARRREHDVERSTERRERTVVDVVAGQAEQPPSAVRPDPPLVLVLLAPTTCTVLSLALLALARSLAPSSPPALPRVKFAPEPLDHLREPLGLELVVDGRPRRKDGALAVHLGADEGGAAACAVEGEGARDVFGRGG